MAAAAVGAGAIVWRPATPELKYEQSLTSCFSNLFDTLFSGLLHIKFIAAVSWVCGYIIDPVTAFFTVSYVSLTGNRRKAVSFSNSIDPAFTTGPYDTQQFPFNPLDADKHGYHEWIAHFLCLTTKVAYEEEEVIQCIVTSKWRWNFGRHFETAQANDAPVTKDNVLDDRRARGSNRLPTSPSEEHSAKAASRLIPATHASVISNEHAVVLFFRGTTPSNLVEWWTCTQADLREEDGVIHGACHAGWYDALFYPVRNPRLSIFQRICEQLVFELGIIDGDKQKQEKKLYITGHSLGGGLASILSHVLATLYDEAQGRRAVPLDTKSGISVPGVEQLFTRLASVFTFAGPLPGDATFVRYMADTFTGPGAPKLFRILHSSDIVPRVPLPVMGYRHHPLEYFLSFDGFIYTEPQDIQLAKATELVFFVRIFWWKFLKNWTIYAPDGNNEFTPMPWAVQLVKLSRCFFHSLIRLAFAFTVVAGHVDHWSSEYEQKLRVMAQELNACLNPPSGQHRPSEVTTHLMSRVRPEEVPAAQPLQQLLVNGNSPHA